jgi:chorismate mutase/prephenate dehydratase
MPPRKHPAPAVNPKGGSRSKSADSSPTTDLAPLRAQIDRIDLELVDLLNRRAAIAMEIGRIKDQQGLAIYSPAREEQVLDRVQSASKGPLPHDNLRAIFRELMSASRAIQRPLRVAFLGPKFSYSHQAAVTKFGRSIEHVPVGSIAAVFEEVNRRHVQFGLVPLENSTDGRIADTLDMFIRLPNLKIRAEVKLRIHHCLLARCKWEDVNRVYSKAQPISQCRNWLGKNLPQARIVDVASSAAAAELAAGEEFAAAIASRQAAEGLGLEILAENIEDHPNNLTRFAVISEHAEGRTGRDKTTLMVRVPNEPGALARIIEPLAKQGVNMTWIESFPAPDSPLDRDPTYLFFLDVDGHADDEPVAKAITSLRKRCERLEVLGSYPRGATIEG